MLYAFLLNVVIRIPFFTHAQGNDAFIVAWMAKALQKGFIDVWIITPLSIFGLYPYSFYPIGGPFILSMLFTIGFNFDTGILAFSFLFMCIAIITTYYLGKLIFRNNQILIFFFVVFYTTSPLFLQLSYWTATVREPFLAILPMVLYFNFKLFKDFNYKTLIYFVLSLALLALMHRLVVLYPLYILAFVCGRRLIKSKYYKQEFFPVFLISYVLMFIIGIFLFPIDPRKTVEFILSNDSIIGVAWNLIIDYALRFGFITLLATWGFFKQFSLEKSNENDRFTHAFFLLLGFFSMAIAPVSTYSSLLVLPWFAYFAVLGLKSMIKRQREQIKYIVGVIPAVFSISYALFVLVLPIHLIAAFLLAAGSILRIFIKEEKIDLKRINSFYIILCVSILLFSRISVDGLFSSKSFPSVFTSEDEIIITEYLQTYNTKKEIILVYHYMVAARIQSLAFQPVLFPGNYPANVYYGWISSEEIRNETVFDFLEIFDSGIPFKTNLTFPETYLRRQVLGLDLQNTRNIETLNNFKIRYIITDNIPSGYYISEYGQGKARLLTSIIEVGILRIETRNLRLYEVPSKFPLRN